MSWVWPERPDFDCSFVYIILGCLFKRPVSGSGCSGYPLCGPIVYIEFYAWLSFGAPVHADRVAIVGPNDVISAFQVKSRFSTIAGRMTQGSRSAAESAAKTHVPKAIRHGAINRRTEPSRVGYASCFRKVLRVAAWLPAIANRFIRNGLADLCLVPKSLLIWRSFAPHLAVSRSGRFCALVTSASPPRDLG